MTDLWLWLGVLLIILVLWWLVKYGPKVNNQPNSLWEQWQHLPPEEIERQCRIMGKKARQQDPLFPLYPSRYEVPNDHKQHHESAGQRCCRHFLQTLYPGEEFPTVRPDWLKNPRTGCNLELDGYSEKLNLAVEYNGEQHYNENHYYNTSKDKFRSQQERDRLKEQRCVSNGVYLIVVPYTIDKHVIRYYVYSKLLDRTLKK